MIFPAESYAEKEGTVVHPDGRLQRLRRAIGRQGETRAEWQVLAELSARLGHDLGVLTASMVTTHAVRRGPVLRRARRSTRSARAACAGPRASRPSAYPAAPAAPFELEAPPVAAPANGRLRLGHVPLDLGRVRGRGLAGAEVPAPAPARRARAAATPSAWASRRASGSSSAPTAHSVSGVAHIRAGALEGTVSLETAIPQDGANQLDGPLVEVRRA